MPFSPDGPLTWGEMDVVRTDVFVPGLMGLLPAKAVSIGDKWSASASAVQELTDLEKIDEGTLDCKLERIGMVGKRRRRVTFTGLVRGVGEDGPVRHRLQGNYHFDLGTNHLTDLTLIGTTMMAGPDGKEAGAITGRFVMTRELGGTTAAIGDAALKGVKLDPDDDNTQMLYEDTSLGVRFLHARRWRVAQVMGSQVALAASDGNGILITIDPPERVPTAAAFMEESRGVARQEEGHADANVHPARLRNRPTLHAFALEAKLGEQRVWMDYYVTAQAGGGATIAARLDSADLPAIRREVEKIARVRLSRRRSRRRRGSEPRLHSCSRDATRSALASRSALRRGYTSSKQSRTTRSPEWFAQLLSGRLVERVVAQVQQGEVGECGRGGEGDATAFADAAGGEPQVGQADLMRIWQGRWHRRSRWGCDSGRGARGVTDTAIRRAPGRRRLRCRCCPRGGFAGGEAGRLDQILKTFSSQPGIAQVEEDEAGEMTGLTKNAERSQVPFRSPESRARSLVRVAVARTVSSTHYPSEPTRASRSPTPSPDTRPCERTPRAGMIARTTPPRSSRAEVPAIEVFGEATQPLDFVLLRNSSVCAGRPIAPGCAAGGRRRGSGRG